MSARANAVTAVALAAFFVVVQFYTSLAALSPTPPVGFVFATPAFAGVLIAVLALATLACLERLWRDRAGPAGASRALLAAWILSAALSGFLGFDPLASAQVVGVMLATGIFHVALVRYFDEPGVARTVVGAYLATGVVASLAALAMFATRVPASLWSLNHGRAAGFFVTANQLAAYLIALLFVAIGVALGWDGALRRLALGAVALALASLAATVSVAGWLGAGVGATYLALALGAKRLAAAIVLCGSVAALAVALRPAAGHDPSDTFDRLRIWRAGVRVAELFPLWGVGPMAYWRVYPEIRPPDGDAPGTFGALHPHDAYLSLAGETGLLGLAAFGYGWWRFARAMRPALRAAPAARRKFALGACAALIAVLVQGLFDTIGIVEMAFVWIPFTALALAAAGAGRRAPWLGVLLACVALHGCVRAPAPSGAASATPAAKASSAAVPIEVTSHKIGSKYILLTVFQKRNRDRKSYVLRADSETGKYFGQDSGHSTFVNPHVIFYGADGKQVVADAPTGTVVEKDKTVLMSGGVHARTQDGMTLTSDTLRYDDEGQTAHGEGHVVVTSTQGETLRGETVDWNLRDGRIDVGGAR